MSRKFLLAFMATLTLLLIINCDRITQEEETSISTDDSTQVSITGTIINEDNNQPVQDVNISIEEKPNKSASTDSSGSFKIKNVLLTKTRTLQFNISPPQGYKSKTISREIQAEAGDQSVGEISLQMEDYIEPISISGTVVDIESQESLGNARIIIQEYLEKQKVTGSDGSFEFTDIKINEEKSLRMLVKRSDYKNDTLDIEVAPNQDKEVLIELERKPKEPDNINFLGTSPETIQLKGTGGDVIGTLEFEVRNEENDPIDISEDATIDVELLNNPVGTRLSTTGIKTNQEGIADVALVSGDEPGVVKIRASIDYEDKHIETSPIPITIHSGFPYNISVGPTREEESDNPGQNNIPALAAGEQSYEFSASLVDSFGNPPAEGTRVYFTTDYGKIMSTDETGATDNKGLTTVTFLSTPFHSNAYYYNEGPKYIYAETVNRNEEYISDQTPILYTGPTKLYFEEEDPSFSVSYSDSEPATFTFYVEDPAGNPISPGSMVNIETTPSDGISANTNFPEGGLPDAIEPGPRITKFTLSISNTQPDPTQEKFYGTASVTINVSSENGDRSLKIVGNVPNPNN